VRPASAVCPSCGLSDAQAKGKLIPKPKPKHIDLAADSVPIGMASTPTDDLAKLVVARSSDISTFAAGLGALTFAAMFGTIGSLGGLPVALVLFFLGGFAGLATGARAGEVVEAAALLVAREALRRASTLAGPVEGTDSLA
jgi:hypothetical protein